MSALPAAAMERTAPPGEPPAAMITASYAPDFERCRLLCETADRYVAGCGHHYILVEARDVPLFRRLQGPRRTIVDERELLPSWLHAFDDPLSGFRRRVWLSLRTKPLRGWHVQQLRRIAIAARLAQSTLVYCDSDVVFLRPFDLAAFRSNGRARLFRRADVLDAPDLHRQRLWAAQAGRALGLAGRTRHDYITTLIAWDRDTVAAMCAHIERVHGRSWIEAIAATRHFSECMLYGRYVDEVAGGAGHFHADGEFCRVLWWKSAMPQGGLQAFLDAMTADQVAIGLQSFIGADLDFVRKVALPG